MSRLPTWLIVGALTVVFLIDSVSAHPGGGILVARNGRIFFAFGPAHSVLTVSPEGEVQRFLDGRPEGEKERFRNPHHLARDAQGSIYTAGDGGDKVWKVGADGAAVVHYPTDEWPRSLAVSAGGDPFTIAPNGDVITVNSRQHEFVQIARVTPTGRVTIIADATWGHRDGARGEAQLLGVHNSTFVLGPDGSLYFTEAGTCVRKIAPDGSVTTLAGKSGERAHVDGLADEARFELAMGLARADDGALFVADSYAHRIRRIAPDGEVTTIAGTGKRGHVDGAVAVAQFEEPSGVAVGPDGAIYVLETAWRHATREYEGRVRKIHQGEVSTVARVAVSAPPRTEPRDR